MAIVHKSLGIDVLEAANVRIKNLFESGVKVYCNVSGGKDSIVMMSLLYDFINAGEIDASQLEVVFIDEEVIYPSVVEICEEWRKKFLLAGAKYTWFAIEHRNNNCFNALENNENFIPWDRYEKNSWAREKPKFAESESPFLKARIESYQDFLTRSQKDGIAVIGVRVAESMNRLIYISRVNKTGGLSEKNVMYPIYDWQDSDVWKYISDRNLNFPEVYLKMYEAGTPKRNLRVCSLFAIDTCNTLTRMFEIYPDLWESILKREPNAYLVRLYWDTEMFRRNTKRKKELENALTVSDKADYKSKLIDVVNHPKKYFRNPHALKVCKLYRQLILKHGGIINEKHYEKLYTNIMAGDTKTRNLRALTIQIAMDYMNNDKTKYDKLKLNSRGERL